MSFLPTISIITICKNMEQLIADTIESVLQQSYPRIEYLIVDGESDDDSLAVARRIIRSYPQKSVKIISEPDDGIADAMNKGIKLSSGEVVAFLHTGDRYINSSVIEKVMDSYSRNACRWAVAGSIVVDTYGNEQHVYKPSSDYRTLLKKNCIPHQSTFLVRDIFNKHGLFKVEYKQAMDYEYWLRIVFKGGERFSVLPFNTTYFLDGGKSSRIVELLKYLKRLRKSMPEYGCDVSTIANWLFLSRVMAFHIFYRLKKKLSMNGFKFLEKE